MALFQISECCVFLQQVGDTDYPSYHEVPRGLTFSCNQKGPGYYADPETQCQVRHYSHKVTLRFSYSESLAG